MVPHKTNAKGKVYCPITRSIEKRQEKCRWDDLMPHDDTQGK